MTRKRTITLAPADPDAFSDRYILAETDEPDLTLGALLHDLPALSLQPLEPALLGLLVRSLLIEVVRAEPGTPLFLPPGTSLAAFSAGIPGEGDETVPPPETDPRTDPEEDDRVPPVTDAHPELLSERQAVLIAHAREMSTAASYLESGLSVLVRCEKLLVEHLAQQIAAMSGRPFRRIRVPSGHDRPESNPLMGGGRRSELMAGLEKAVVESVPGDLVVIPQLDLLAGGSDASLSGEARELTDLLYEHSERVILAFTDPSLVIPEVLANRFAVRLAMDILPREVRGADGRAVPIGRALVTREEAELFTGFDPAVLYKHIAGMNAVRLRHGMLFAHHQHRMASESVEVPGSGPTFTSLRPDLAGPREAPTFAGLLQELRTFKARTSSAFDVPNVSLDSIGGYGDVKEELKQALKIISGAAAAEHKVPEHLRHDLIPRGFIFHGPPGTGKTLFAKAIASRLDATILVVSGPEITDMYVGESERKLRDLFTEARRNAPAVLVFDEFDSIAGRRTGRDDGGSRAGNAIVAQLLTELDGFRPEVPVLIIGTTNRIDIIDDALLRPSRFKPIKIDLPNEPARLAIAKVHAEHFGVDVSERLLLTIARATEGMNGDEIRSIFRNARAEQLVGQGREPDARHLGELVGRLRWDQQQRDIDKQDQNGRARPASGERRRPQILWETQVGPADDADATGPANAPGTTNTTDRAHHAGTPASHDGEGNGTTS
ncbi:ATP-binding protein [Streptosporangium sp. NPDC023825]|uniref:ATP-binding protein n=1 Tax=Streptosporangium sp. NPDC023825 TaxID=3154909 RepID=UPI00341DB420